MNQPGPVGHRQAGKDRAQHRHDGVRRHWAALAQQFSQRATLDEFHHEKGMAAVEALIVNGYQARVFQPRDGTGLALKTRQELLIACVARFHHLDRDRAVQPGVEPAIHRRHAAGGDDCLDAVPTVKE